MESLLKLQAHVVDTADNDDTLQPKRAISIPALRLADAKWHADTDQHEIGTESGALTVVAPSAPARRDGAAKATWRPYALPCTAAPPAAAKAALVEGRNSRASVAYPGGAVLPALMANLTDVEQLLYTMLPPRRTFRKDTGETVMELVSAEPASRVEVAELHARLLERLRQRRARDSGVCPIRREIYAEVFDELIRQITIEEPVRGLLMLRVRDELYQTLAAHQSLAERSMYFAAKQRAEALDGLDVLQRRLQELEEERGLLLTKRRAVQVREEQLLHAIEEENVVRTKGRQDELGYYRRANRQLSQRIKAETERANAHGMAVNTVVLEAEGGEGTLPSAV